jgi:hypothetical protein
MMATLPAPDASSKPIDLVFITEPNSRWKLEVGEDFVSPAYGITQRAPAVRSHIQTTLPKDLAVLFEAIQHGSRPGAFEVLDESSLNGVRGYRYQTDDTSELLFFAQPYVRWVCGSWSADSQLLYCKSNHDSLTQIVMIRGTFAEWQGKRFIDQPSRTNAMEWPDASASTSEFHLKALHLENFPISTINAFDSVPSQG